MQGRAVPPSQRAESGSPEVSMYLVCLKNVKGARVAGMEGRGEKDLTGFDG